MKRPQICLEVLYTSNYAILAALDRFVFAREYKYDRILQTLKQFLLKGVAK